MTAVLGYLEPILGVNPVPWSWAQMAFTLAFHIILVPLGVSWAFMALIANYRGIKHNDQPALQLAQRWSKYMAVTFAVGAVTGTVLSFEFGLLWPKFMGQWGEAFGVPFAFEGIFFFTEAIFISIYIYGWRRLKPWPHFWTGVPVVLTGILGSVSVVAANAWMNDPSGFTLDSAGKVVDVDPWGVIFNDAMPLMAAHMVIAAYVVGGFLVASVYAVGDAARPAGPLPPPRLHHPLHGRRHRHPDPDGRRRLPGPLGVQQPAGQVRRHRARPRDRERRPRDTARTAQRRRPGDRRDPDPRARLLAVGSRHREGHGRPGPRHGARGRPTDHEEVNTVHLAWDVMVGLGTLLFLLSAWYGLCWLFRRDMPRSKLFLRIASCAGVAAIVCMEAGWTVSEVGRQPWIVYNHMKVEELPPATPVCGSRSSSSRCCTSGSASPRS